MSLGARGEQSQASRVEFVVQASEELERVGSEDARRVLRRIAGDVERAGGEVGHDESGLLGVHQSGSGGRPIACQTRDCPSRTTVTSRSRHVRAASVPKGCSLEGAVDRLRCRSVCRFTTRRLSDALVLLSGGRRCSATVRRGCFSLPLPSLSRPRSRRRRSDSTRSDHAPSREGLRPPRRHAVMRRRSSGTPRPPPG